MAFKFVKAVSSSTGLYKETVTPEKSVVSSKVTVPEKVTVSSFGEEDWEQEESRKEEVERRRKKPHRGRCARSKNLPHIWRFARSDALSLAEGREEENFFLFSVFCFLFIFVLPL
ncbi:MAG: hypothetical protein K8R79_10100 [Calditrichales bacterium]|nr:hypothetical protein [Calditrichales bacterium]